MGWFGEAGPAILDAYGDRAAANLRDAEVGSQKDVLNNIEAEALPCA